MQFVYSIFKILISGKINHRSFLNLNFEAGMDELAQIL